MTDVSEWAREQAAQIHPRLPDYRLGYVHGADHLAALLLSDEAVSALAEKFYDAETGTTGKYPTSNYRSAWDRTARAALQAALDKITEAKE